MSKKKPSTPPTADCPTKKLIIKGGGKVLTFYGHAKYQDSPDSLECTRSLWVNGREIILTSAFPKHPTSTPTRKMKSYIDLNLENP